MSISQRLSWTAPSVTIDASRKQIDAVVSRELCCAANECRCVAAVCCCCCLSSHGTTGGAFVKRWVAPAATIALLVLFVLNTAILAGTREYHFMLAPFYFKFDALDQSVVAELFKEKKRGGEDWNLDDILSSGESMFQDDLSVKDNIFSTYFSV